jgi:hypothetical protein
MRRSKRKRDQEREDESRQYRLWRQWRRERVEPLLAGPYGEALRELLPDLRNLPPASELLAKIESGPWRNADADTRHEILALLDAAVIAHREKLDLVPFDDPTPEQPDNMFLKLRALLSRETDPPQGGDPEPNGGINPRQTAKGRKCHD